MKRLLPIIPIIVVAFSFCKVLNADNFKFGIKYNAVRAAFGSPLIKRNMTVSMCCGQPTLYTINEIPANHTPYHSSKTIRAFSDKKINEEKDIYRESIDDTTILQLNILSRWDWQSRVIRMVGNTGKIDKRELALSATAFLQSKQAQYPQYNFIELNPAQIDSVLSSWGLSRFDKE